MTTIINASDEFINALSEKIEREKNIFLSNKNPSMREARNIKNRFVFLYKIVFLLCSELTPKDNENVGYNFSESDSRMFKKLKTMVSNLETALSFAFKVAIIRTAHADACISNYIDYTASGDSFKIHSQSILYMTQHQSNNILSGDDTADVLNGLNFYLQCSEKPIFDWKVFMKKSLFGVNFNLIVGNLRKRCAELSSIIEEIQKEENDFEIVRVENDPNFNFEVTLATMYDKFSYVNNGAKITS